MIYLTQCIHRNSQKFPNKIATSFKGRQHTWTEFEDRVARFAHSLQKLGIRPNDRVGILALNSDRYLEYYMAVPWAGCAVVALNTRWNPKENAYSLKDSGTKILLIDDAFLDQIATLKNENLPVEHYIYIGERDIPSGMLSYEDLIQSHDPIEDSYRHDDDLAGIYYTGGTTGFPKGAMLTHKSLWTSAMATLMISDLRAEDSYLHLGPMFHLADGAMSNAALIQGSTHFFLPSFTPDGAVRTIQETKTTHTLMVPVMIQLVVATIKKQNLSLDSLRFVLYGASPIPESVLVDALATLPNTNFSQGYGQTELSPLATALTAEYHVLEGPKSGKLKSAGQAVACAELKIVDNMDRILEANKIGEVVVRGPNRMLGYWNKPEETAKALRDGWIYTGDIGYLDEDGFLFLVDRAKDMIVTGGENVYSTEVENVIMKHDSVQQCIVIGIPHTKWGEMVHAEIILNKDHSATEEEIIVHCKQQIANYKSPKSVKFRTEPFPISGAGKLLKREVRKQYWGDKDRSIN